MSVAAVLHSKISTILGHTRVYPTIAPQSAALPYIIYNRYVDRAERHQGGSEALAMASYQVTIMADSALAAYTIADQLREGMDGVQMVTIASTQVRRITLTNERDETTLFDSSQVQTFTVTQDYNLWYFRTATPGD